ncbi:hypothetical protein G6F46_004011 [Rhizopus delemar]|uniref:Arrestin-like N-terminal domain-containing protein n=2 Tax=Rhizopus TaxID=4842 RepID=A0A9P7CJ16_9FUNG|nr:hypothetical protein G6F55_011911 [Rhizopus delemar]KAG1534064.1 hypothetical protein G6F51_012298 [Rhizopus arrhizus]KAG1488482.1 hypothetical protein G6F54_012056 [Rhizopus delemar]KAG1496570.1 hypothetical protein G6F53_012153 [Rhizopus delemar]KAG1560414.1 hypothetical protein G6F49_002712 [Rhizopus delemar]
MHLGLLSQERLSFDPIKPLILRGPPTEVASSVFTGTVVLSLTRSTKIAGITVTFKSVATTYWPEGIGARGTRLTHEKVLSEESVQILEAKKNEFIKLTAGIHRFPFAFIVPNSIVETIEDVYGRVRHTVDARVSLFESGIQQMLNNWHASKPVLVLRAYMSDSLLTNNSLQDLSRTYEKQLPAADVQLVVERAAFSSGDLFFLRLILEPHRKKVRLEHMELSVIENRRYNVAEARANRTDTEIFHLAFLKSVKLVEGSESISEGEGDLRSVFVKNGKGVDLTDTIAYRITFATPTCMRNIHHTTYYKDILFRHYLNITLTISFIDDEASFSRPIFSTNSSTSSFGDESSGTSIQTACANNSNNSTSIEQQVAETTSALVTPPPVAFSPHTDIHARQSMMINNNSENAGVIQHMNNLNANPIQQSTWLSKLRKSTNQKENGTQVIRKRETIRLETPITVFDCRLKEDYGRLPSYSELNVTSANLGHGDDKNKLLQEMMEQDLMLQCMPDSDEQIPSSEPQPQLCSCYFKFRRQMEMASQFQLFSTSKNNSNETLERIPSIPPPDYVEN